MEQKYSAQLILSSKTIDLGSHQGVKEADLDQLQGFKVNSHIITAIHKLLLVYF